MNEPSINTMTTSSYFFSMFASFSVYMIESKHVGIDYFTTLRPFAFPTVMSNNLQLDFLSSLEDLLAIRDSVLPIDLFISFSVRGMKQSVSFSYSFQVRGAILFATILNSFRMREIVLTVAFLFYFRMNNLILCSSCNHFFPVLGIVSFAISCRFLVHKPSFTFCRRIAAMLSNSCCTPWSSSGDLRDSSALSFHSMFS